MEAGKGSVSRWLEENQRPQVHLAVRHLERWPLQTTYAKIAADQAARLDKLPCCTAPARLCQRLPFSTRVSDAPPTSPC
jgi:hypothetical protein